MRIATSSLPPCRLKDKNPLQHIHRTFIDQLIEGQRILERDVVGDQLLQAQVAVNCIRMMVEYIRSWFQR